VTKTAVRAVVIDPDPLWQQAVTAALTRSDVSVVANSSDPTRAPDLAAAHAADLLLVGLEDEVDNRDLYRLLRRIHKRCPDLVTVVFLENEDRLTVDAALAGGAYWVVDRRHGVAELVRAVTEAYRTQLGVQNRKEAIHWLQGHGFDEGPEDGPRSGVREPRRPINPSRAGDATVDPNDERDPKEGDSPDETNTPRDTRSQAA
jgi:DNA-binding NtrC family response regulator